MAVFKIEYEEVVRNKCVAKIEADSEEEVVRLINDTNSILFKALVDWETLEVKANSIELVDNED